MMTAMGVIRDLSKEVWVSMRSTIVRVRIPTRNSIPSPFELSIFLSSPCAREVSQSRPYLFTPSRPCRSPCTPDLDHHNILRTTTLSAFSKALRPSQPRDWTVLSGMNMTISTSAYQLLFVCRRVLKKLAARSLSNLCLARLICCFSAYVW